MFYTLVDNPHTKFETVHDAGRRDACLANSCYMLF